MAVQGTALLSTLSASAFEHSSSAAGGGVDVDVDLTVFGQIALFVVLMLALKPLLFDPLLQLFEERERRIEGARAESLALDKESAAAQGRYEREMQQARNVANAERDKLRAEGARAEAEIMAKARDVSAHKLEQGRAALAADLDSARSALSREVSALSAQVASKVLGREIRG